MVPEYTPTSCGPGIRHGGEWPKDAEPGPARLGRLVQAVRPGARLLGTCRPQQIKV